MRAAAEGPPAGRSEAARASQMLLVAAAAAATRLCEAFRAAVARRTTSSGRTGARLQARATSRPEGARGASPASAGGGPAEGGAAAAAGRARPERLRGRAAASRISRTAVLPSGRVTSRGK